MELMWSWCSSPLLTAARPLLSLPGPHHCAVSPLSLSLSFTLSHSHTHTLTLSHLTPKGGGGMELMWSGCPSSLLTAARPLLSLPGPHHPASCSRRPGHAALAAHVLRQVVLVLAGPLTSLGQLRQGEGSPR